MRLHKVVPERAAAMPSKHAYRNALATIRLVGAFARLPLAGHVSAAAIAARKRAGKVAKTDKEAAFAQLLLQSGN
jgi:hypothetical protein